MIRQGKVGRRSDGNEFTRTMQLPRLRTRMFERGLKSVIWYLILVAPGFAHQAADSDQKLASDFWSWRARYAPYTSDDVPRMERPAGVVRDWSAASVEGQRKELAGFDERWRNLADKTVPVSQ